MASAAGSAAYHPGMSKVMVAPLCSRVMARTPRCMDAPVSGHTGLSIVFLLERQQQELADNIRREFDVERARLRRHMIDILPNAMIRLGGHRFVEVRPLLGLDRRHDLGTTEPKRG